MKRILNSILAAALLLLLVVVVLIATFKLRAQWWMFIDIFFAFMMCFAHLMALTVRKMSLHASRTLDRVALVCGVLCVVAFIVEFCLML